MFIDILFFAAIAAFVAYRLHGVLGRKDFDPEADALKKLREKKTIFETLKQATSGGATAAAPEMKDVTPARAQEEEANRPFAKEVNALREYNPGFSLEEFTEGAKRAFEMIISAFSKEEKETLKPLLGKDLYQSFSSDIDTRKGRGEELHTTLVRFVSAQVKAISILKKHARITVEFVTEQISLVRNKKGETIEGHPSHIDEVTDVWTFEKDLQASSPVWTLVATKAG